MVEDKIRRCVHLIFGDDGAKWLALTAVVFALVVTLMLVGVSDPALAQETLAKKEAAALDCGDFATQRGAQAIFTRSPIASAGDPFKLDKNSNGVACEKTSSGATEDGTKLGANTGGDLDCVDYPSQAAAQASLRADPSDPNGLDPENNGVACEYTPVSYKNGAFDDTPVAAARSNADLDCKDFEYQQEAQIVYLQDVSDPNGLDGPNEKAEKDKRFVGNGFACETLPLLASNVEEMVGKVKDTKAQAPKAPESAPLALVASWPHGGELGFVLDFVALLLAASGVSALLIVLRAPRSPDKPGQ